MPGQRALTYASSAVGHETTLFDVDPSIAERVTVTSAFDPGHALSEPAIALLRARPEQQHKDTQEMPSRVSRKPRMSHQRLGDGDRSSTDAIVALLDLWTTHPRRVPVT